MAFLIAIRDNQPHSLGPLDVERIRKFERAAEKEKKARERAEKEERRKEVQKFMNI